jgi:type III secretion protein N (ATPase)
VADVADLSERLASASSLMRTGRLRRAGGVVMRASGVDASIGQTCEIADPQTGRRLLAEVVGLEDGEALLTPLGDAQGLSSRAEVRPGGRTSTVPFGEALLSRVIDANGEPLDGLGPLPALPRRPLYAEAPNPMSRPPIVRPLPTGLRAVDAGLTLGIGQRVGIFAMAGVGKTTFLGMLARGAQADLNVVALIGERGREVRELIEDTLGSEGLARSVVVVATSDRPARERARAAYAATAIAEGFRAEGRHCLLLMDSVTRFARALREVGLASGEPPVRRGLPPSVFAELPRLFERAGATEEGAITGIYTVLVEDEEDDDPVGEETRSLLDGHVVLSRARARAGAYPAIDLPASVSRLAPRLQAPTHAAAATRLRALIAKHEEVALLLRVGEYAPGGDPEADAAIERMPAIERLLRQDVGERADWDGTLAMLAEAVGS